MLTSMGFDDANSLQTAQIFGSDVNGAVHFITSEAYQNSLSQQKNLEEEEEDEEQSNDNVQNQNQNTTKKSVLQEPELELDLEEPESEANQMMKYSNNNNNNLSPDDIATEEIFEQIQRAILIDTEYDRKQNSIYDDDNNNNNHSNYNYNSNNSNNNNGHHTSTKQQKKPFKPQTAEELEYDAKTNETINAQARLSLTNDEILSESLVHKAAWFGDILSLKKYPPEMLNTLDKNGNTPLSLATRLGHDTVSNKMLEMGADPRIELPLGWNVIQEAVLNQDDRLVRDLLIHEIQLRSTEYESRQKILISKLLEMTDFYMEIKWQVQSTLAVLNSFIDKFAKMDNFKIWKRGASIRFDMFMRGFSATGVEKGHLSFVFTEGNIVSVDHDRQTFTNAIRKFKNPDYDEFEREVRVLMRTEQGRASLRTSDVHFTPKKGWMGGDKIESVQGYDCEVMTTSGLAHCIISEASGNARQEWQYPSFEEYFFSTDGSGSGSGEENGKPKNHRRSLLGKIKRKQKQSNNNNNNNGSNNNENDLLRTMNRK